MKPAAAIILYHPDETAIANVFSYAEHADHLFIFDNTESPSLAENVFAGLSKFSYYYDADNKGIAARLNTAANLAIKRGYQWLLTLDQDTQFTAPAMNVYLDCFHKFPGKHKVAMFGTKYHKEKAESSPACMPVNVERLITSGMLLNLQLFSQLGGFDEQLFIDLVDDDYCIAASLAGFSIVQFANISIAHKLGTSVHRASVKTLFLVKKTKAIHSPLRCYYMYRNLLYLRRKYKGARVPLAEQLPHIVLSHIKVCLLYGRQSLAILKQLLAATKDFRANRMGKKTSV